MIVVAIFQISGAFLLKSDKKYTNLNFLKQNHAKGLDKIIYVC